MRSFFARAGGEGLEQLNAPYDAKQIGDYTGLTPPGDFHEQGDSD